MTGELFALRHFSAKVLGAQPSKSVRPARHQRMTTLPAPPELRAAPQALAVTRSVYIALRDDALYG